VMYGPPPCCKRKCRLQFGLRKCIRSSWSLRLLTLMECMVRRRVASENVDCSLVYANVFGLLGVLGS
jgi:hypothetical protein